MLNSESCSEYFMGREALRGMAEAEGLFIVIPAKAGIQINRPLDSSLRWNDTMHPSLPESRSDYRAIQRALIAPGGHDVCAGFPYNLLRKFGE